MLKLYSVNEEPSPYYCLPLLHSIQNVYLNITYIKYIPNELTVLVHEHLWEKETFTWIHLGESVLSFFILILTPGDPWRPLPAPSHTMRHTLSYFVHGTIFCWSPSKSTRSRSSPYPCHVVHPQLLPHIVRCLILLSGSLKGTETLNSFY